MKRPGFGSCSIWKIICRSLIVCHVILLSILVFFFPIPVNLSTDTPYNTDFPGPQREAVEKMTQFIHPVSRIFRVDITDPHQNITELIIHSFQFVSVGQAGFETPFYRMLSGLEQFITYNHDRLGQIKGGKFSGGYCHQGMAQPDVGIGKAPVFGPENNRDLVFVGNRYQLVRQFHRLINCAALAP